MQAGYNGDRDCVVNLRSRLEIPEKLRHWLARALQAAECYEDGDEARPQLYDEESGEWWAPPEGTELRSLAELLDKARRGQLRVSA